MKILDDVIIAPEKLSRYLLVPRLTDDKARFLARGGFTLENPGELETAIRWLARSMEAVQDGRSEYGTFWRVEGCLRGPLRELSVVLIFLERSADRRISLVTLKPSKGTGR